MNGRRAAWTAGLAGLVVVPVATAAAWPSPGWAFRGCDAAGVAALSLLAAAVLIGSRRRSLTAAIGIDTVLSWHRRAAWAALAAVAAHIELVVYLNGPAILTGPTAAAKAALAATVALAGLVGSAALRRRRWETWRGLHLALTAVVLAASGLHVYWLDHMISQPVLRAGFAALAGCVLAVAAHRWLWRPLRARSFTVAAARANGVESTTLTLRARRGRHRPGGPARTPFRAGQFAWLRTRRLFGQEHPYSMSSSARDPSVLEFTLRGDYARVLSRLPLGKRVWLDGPHGAFTVSERSPGTVFIAAGVGMAPILSMLRSLADAGDTRPHRLVHAAGARHGLGFGSDLAALAPRLHLDVLPVLTRPHPGWAGASGVVSAPLLDAFLPGNPVRSRLEFFVCGPPALLADATTALRRLGISPRRVHVEPFDPIRKVSGAHSAVRPRRPAGPGPDRVHGGPRPGRPEHAPVPARGS